MEQPTNEENKNVSPETPRNLLNAYGEGSEGEEELKYARSQIQRINNALELREKNSVVSNGIPYSRAYVYNQNKAINYAPPRNPKDDREVSMGLPHEKIIAFSAIFIKYAWNRLIKCYDKNGNLINGLGDVYDLAIEYSQRAEQFKKKIALIYWEVFSQGNAFILEDWDVRTINRPVAYKKAEEGDDKVEVNAQNMDYTYEFLDNLSYEDGKEDVQVRRAVSKIMDGRMVIFGNPEIEEVQDQPLIALEEELDRADAEQLYGTLKRWKQVPSSRVEIDEITVGEKVTLYDVTRLADPKKKVIVHREFDKINNRFNIFINGMMMLPRRTPMSIFYPRMNYPITNVPAERLTGSIYSRSIPAKTKFNSDFVDWALKNLALKFEQGVIPAIFMKGKYTLSRDIFRAGQVTHGVSRSDFEKADPENQGVTVPEMNFVTMLKDIVEAQTLNPTTSGELQAGATATEIGITDQNQRDKLGYLLDGIANAFMDLALRRAETIESKYTIKQRETEVDGKKIAVYQNFNINIGGINNSVIFSDAIGSPTYNHQEESHKLFKKSFDSKKEGNPTEFFLADPARLRRGEHVIDIEIVPSRIREKDLQLTSMWNEFTMLLNTFKGAANLEQMKKIYLQISGRPAEMFNSAEAMKLDEMAAAAAQGEAPAAPVGTPNGGSPLQPKKTAPNKQVTYGR